MDDVQDEDSARPLSPITELTTPGYFRTVPLPDFDVPDYASEHERTPSPDHSIRFHGSGDTITSRLPRYSAGSHLAQSPPGAPRFSVRPSPLPIPTRHRTYPFPHDASPGGLLPPPRPITGVLTPPTSPSPYGPLSDEARRRYAERYGLNLDNPSNPVSPAEFREPSIADGQVGPNLAGVGAGEACRVETAQHRPNSFHASRTDLAMLDSRDLAIVDLNLQADHIPRLISPEGRTHGEFHNIPYVPDHRTKGWSGPPSGSAAPAGRGGRSPANSRPNSLKNRPRSFQSSRQGSRRGSLIEAKAATSPEQLGDKTTLMKLDADPTSPLTIVTRHSESSLVRSNSSPPSSQAQESNTQRRRRPISSIFGSIFTSDKAATPPRRLSKPARTVSKGSRGTPTTPSPMYRDVSPTLLEPEPATAIRTSGTFGIGDDGTVYRLGSESVSAPSSPQSQPMRERTMSSGAGSVQSLGVQRVLFVSNVDGTVFEDDEGLEAPATHLSDGSARVGQAAEVHEESTEESGTSGEVFYTPIDIDSSTSPTPDELLNKEATSITPNSVTPSRPRFPHRRSLSPPAAPSAMFIPLEATFRQRPLTPPPNAPIVSTARSVPSSPIDDVSTQALSASQITVRQPAAFPAINEKGEMVDEAIQTSPGSSQSPGRPLPRPPSSSSRPPSLIVSSSSHATGPAPHSPHSTSDDPALLSDGPRLNVPPPPPHTPSLPGDVPQLGPQVNHSRSTGSSGPASDLPLLIASHLLSTHAAALMRHSTTMRDVSEVMHQMATESLEWGGVLLGMGHTGRYVSPQQYGTAAASSPVQLAQDSSTLARNSGGSGIDGLPSRSTGPFEQVARETAKDPLLEAWEKLNGLETQPFSSPRSPPHTAQAPLLSYAYETSPAGADRFTTIPPRPSALRKSSRVRLNVDEPARGPPTPLHIHPARPRPDSLPADWLAEADRLGREGWTSLRRAEEAWSSAMTSLRELAERPTSSSRPFFAMAEEGERTIRARSRSRHESLDLSYPRRMDRADQIERERSFLPELSDRSSDRPTAHDRDHDGPHSPAFTLRPAWGHPLIRPHAPMGASVPEGYSAEHLGFENHSTVRDRPRSRLTMTSTVTGGRSTPIGLDSINGTPRRRKLSKRVRSKDPAPPIPSSFRAVSAPVSAVQTSKEGLHSETTRSKGAENGTKRHWWSRRRVESVVS